MPVENATETASGLYFFEFFVNTELPLVRRIVLCYNSAKLPRQAGHNKYLAAVPAL